MECVYNTGGFCYRNNAEEQKKCQYIGSEAMCVIFEANRIRKKGMRKNGTTQLTGYRRRRPA